MKSYVLLLLISLFSFLSYAQVTGSDTIARFGVLKVLAFDAKAINKNVQLLWEVGSNEDVKTFEIERAEEGGVYRKVGSKLPLGQSGQAEYEFVDALPRKNAMLSYRLRAMAKDGTTVLSGIKTVRIGNEALSCMLKQNPVRSTVEIEIMLAEPALVQASIHTAYGQRVSVETAKLSAGKNLLSLSAQDLLPGIHRLAIEAGSERKIISFVKE